MRVRALSSITTTSTCIWCWCCCCCKGIDTINCCRVTTPCLFRTKRDCLDNVCLLAPVTHTIKTHPKRLCTSPISNDAPGGSPASKCRERLKRYIVVVVVSYALDGNGAGKVMQSGGGGREEGKGRRSGKHRRRHRVQVLKNWKIYESKDRTILRKFLRTIPNQNHLTKSLDFSR